MVTTLMLLLIVSGLVLLPTLPLIGTALMYVGVMLQRLAALDEDLLEGLLGAAAGTGALATVVHAIWSNFFTA